jgi:hypothetical protein
MKQKWAFVLVVVLVFALIGVGTAYAQEEPGYPVETETEQPTETKPPSETEAPTEAPTETDLPGYPVETETPTETEPPRETVEPSETSVPTAVPTEEPTEAPTPIGDSPVCDGTRIHPVLDQLAARYNIAYEEIVGYYCNSGLGVGEIALALATIQQSDGSVDLPALFSQRLDENLGWGEIWQGLGLIGNGNTNGNNDLKRNQDRNTHQDRIRNEGEDDQIENQSQYTEQKGNPLVSPPGQEGRDKEKDDNGIGNDPGANPGHSEDKPGNGPKP